MGLTMYYKGRIKSAELLPELIEDVIEISKVNNWKYTTFEEKFPDNSIDNPKHDGNLYGISIIIPDCEPVNFSFLSNGRMSDVLHLKFYGDESLENQEKYLYSLFTKAQFAGIEVYKKILHLYHYASKKYFSDFVLSDDGEYWQVWDENILKEKFRIYTCLIENVSLALQCTQPLEGEDIITSIERAISKIKPDEKNSK